MTGGEKSFDFAVDRLETYKGRADFYNLRKVSERGHDISRLPYSIKILLENAIRHSKTVGGRDRGGQPAARVAEERRLGVPLRPLQGPAPRLHGRPPDSGPRGHEGRDVKAGARTPARSTRSRRSTWSSTTRSRWTGGGAPRHSSTTSRRSTRGTPRGTPC